jgi:hypothetical protein
MATEFVFVLFTKAKLNVHNKSIQFILGDVYWMFAVELFVEVLFQTMEGCEFDVPGFF